MSPALRLHSSTSSGMSSSKKEHNELDNICFGAGWYPVIVYGHLSFNPGQHSLLRKKCTSLVNLRI